MGRYRFSPHDILTVTRQGDHLYVALTGESPIEIFAEGPAAFFLKAANAQVRFGDIRNGRAQKAIWHQAGQDQTADRVN